MMEQKLEQKSISPIGGAEVDSSPTISTKKIKMRNAFITINYNLTGVVIDDAITADTSNLKSLNYTYLVIGEHIGSKSHIRHIHALIEFANSISFNTIKSAVPRARIERRRGTALQAREYINKDKKILFEDGEPSQQGGRFAAIVDMLSEKKEMKEIVKKFPEEYIKFHSGIEAAARILTETSLEDLDEYKGPLIFKDWQQRIIDVVESKPDPRKVFWVTDKLGNTGKTWLGLYLKLKYKAAYFNNSKTADIAYAYNGERTVVFDLARSNEEMVNYQIIEQIKNGILFSPKYQSATKVFNHPHVIIFSNFPPDRSKMSDDRWVIINLSDKKINSKHPPIGELL
ncbi:MAG: hypothetical protein H7836_16605 [Magnetococcus sp. YQC-3]